MEDTPIFPDPPVVTVERTLAIIKPDAVHRADEVMEDIKLLGFSILNVSCRVRNVYCTNEAPLKIKGCFAGDSTLSFIFLVPTSVILKALVVLYN